ncbi:MAG: FAD-dependent oxidoreductase [Pseudomonadota bacterium]
MNKPFLRTGSEEPKRLNIAVVGAGISGLGAACLLSKNHAVTLFEKDDRLGGHANTATVDYDGKEIPVDTGFIVYNRTNYPNLIALFDRLGVATEASDMSFSVSQRSGGFEWAWAGDRPVAIFAQKRNVLNLKFYSLIGEIQHFRRQGLHAHLSGNPPTGSLEDFIAGLGLSDAFRTQYLIPLGAAIWSSPGRSILDFPAENFLRFFFNHHLLSLGKAHWRTVTGGSQCYVRKVTGDMDAEIRQGVGVTRVVRREDGVELTLSDGSTQPFDQVVLATHSDQALSLLDEPDADEKRLLGALRYSDNKAYLHRDQALMPQRRAAWASWNSISKGRGESTGPVFVSYWMNRLQNIDKSTPLFVSLNPDEPPREALTFSEYTYAHPQFDRAAIEAQRGLGLIQGRRGVWFCGAYCGNGFHEDGLSAGLDVAEALGGALRPWAAQQTDRMDTRVETAYAPAAE